MKKLGREKVHCYTGAFRTRLLRSILEEGLSVRDTSNRYGVSMQSLYRWLNDLEMQKETKKESKRSKNESSSSLEAELAALQEELRLERLRSSVYQEMIRQAEQYYNISIEKKSGSKPLK